MPYKTRFIIDVWIGGKQAARGHGINPKTTDNQRL